MKCIMCNFVDLHDNSETRVCDICKFENGVLLGSSDFEVLNDGYCSDTYLENHLIYGQYALSDGSVKIYKAKNSDGEFLTIKTIDISNWTEGFRNYFITEIVPGILSFKSQYFIEIQSVEINDNHLVVLMSDDVEAQLFESVVQERSDISILPVFMNHLIDAVIELNRTGITQLMLSANTVLITTENTPLISLFGFGNAEYLFYLFSSEFTLAEDFHREKEYFKDNPFKLCRDFIDCYIDFNSNCEDYDEYRKVWLPISWFSSEDTLAHARNKFFTVQQWVCALLLKTYDSFKLIRGAEQAQKKREEFVEMSGAPLVKEVCGIHVILIPPSRAYIGKLPSAIRPEPYETYRSYILVGPIYMSPYCVSQEEWEMVMGHNPSEFKGSNLPVENVSWYDVQEFIKKLNSSSHGYFRMPSSSEWEFACRAGTTECFNVGNELNFDSANFKGRSPYGLQTSIFAQTVEVDSYRPNPFGFYNMHGNVFEWMDCLDVPFQYRGSSDEYRGIDGRKQTFDGSEVPVRGGSYASTAFECRSSTVCFADPKMKSSEIGFRLVYVPSILESKLCL